MSDATTGVSAKLCFVVGPIGREGSTERNRSDMLLRYVIEPAMSHRPDFTILRADHISTPGMIDRQIITRLRDADLVIADLATSNPNAFYEIGIRHMVDKPIVHMQDRSENIPFDVSLYSAVFYSLESVQSHEKATFELKRHIDAALDENHEIDNPVTRALGQAKFSQSALPEIELLRNQIASLQNAVRPLLDDRRTKSVREIAEALTSPPTRSLADLGRLIPENKEIPAGLASLFVVKPDETR